MKFRKLPVNSEIEKCENGFFYLLEDNWNDWWEFKTLYQLYYKEDNGEVIYIGGVKIGEIEMESDQRSPNLEEYFTKLDDRFFSIGEDIYYYENLNKLGDELRDNVLENLKDIALDKKLFNKVKNLRVTTRSLLRDKISKLKKLQNLALGNSILTPYNFSFFYHSHETNLSKEFTFYSKPNSHPPTNVQVIIGRNGVGKTYLMNNLLFSIMNKDSKSQIKSNYEKFGYDEKIFENIMYISFSAFDGTDFVKNTKKSKKRPSYSYIGLKAMNSKGNVFNKNTEMLVEELINSMWKCRKIPSKRARLQQALLELNIDPIFNQSDLIEKLKIKEVEFNKQNEDMKKLLKESFYSELRPICKKFSSGHSIVLLTICKLIEELEEKTLVLLDEPESHLHPPLLSTFIRILSDLLVKRNGIGIIATHSPVILQEVPSECVYILDRQGFEINTHRPTIETYGENINTLTKEVFSFELTNSGFHNALIEVANKFNTYEEALAYFDGKLGLEAKAILRNLINIKERDADA
ncbi:AAA family ATPase [Psychrobacillus lasiicapitis]|uniref:ATP-binding protein n=1 Tax=Psychrobacillus lasiicapitis TaxID=1636719 RepID=A0A544T1U8_9BACI|nr:AAA family ATPase [Psychrobacillus lasiicapitis]TQR11408.1 ATP-binding protein [Psychrobacillus lasiicapitis]GGA40793.1 hypothetical protein GCM10011384_33060 [Psychrobacillus lasiicapitis]